MVAALKHVIAYYGWNPQWVRVWCDYISIPQACGKTQGLGVHSLPLYAGCAHAFVMVAPPVKHTETGATVDFTSYEGRMWCRCEQLSYALANGSHAQSWKATSTTDCLLHAMSARDTLNSLRVFQVRT